MNDVNVTRTILLITDGDASDGNRAITDEAAQLKADGVKICGIGIGKVLKYFLS